MLSLSERLGFSSDEKILIINADDLGLCHSANVGVFECLKTGLVTSASLMVPGPWAREACARYRGEDVGVHLTLNSQFELYPWGPITHAPSLLGGDGGFPRTVEDVWNHADLDEVRRECKAQIERAILWGFNVSHLDVHMATLQLRPEFFDIYLDLGIDFGLPLRMLGSDLESFLGFPARQVATEAGVIFTDHTILTNSVGSRELIEAHLDTLQPGVTELHLHPATDSDELRALAPDWSRRVDDYVMVCKESYLKDAIENAGVRLIGFRLLRELARSMI